MRRQNELGFRAACLLESECFVAQVAAQCLILAIGLGAIIVADSRPLGKQLPDEAPGKICLSIGSPDY